jgi:hypothetical protein
MGGILNLIMANGSGSGAQVTVGNTVSANPNTPFSTFGWWGWTTVINTGVGTAPFQLYPDSLPVSGNSVSPTPLIINGLTILGVISRSLPNGTVDANVYYVYVSGNNTTGINTLVVNGTVLTSPTATYDSTGQGSVSNTRFAFNHSDNPTLFGTTVGAKVPISIA